MKLNLSRLRSLKLGLAVGVLVSVAAAGYLTRARVSAQAGANTVIDPKMYQDLKWRSVGPHRGGRSTAASGVRTQPGVFYFGATGGGVWKTTNYGLTWAPVTDGQIETESIGAIAVADSNPDVVYVGTGSEAIRSNVIIGRGVYKSTDAGKTWHFIGLKDVGQIAQIKIHPTNPDIAYVAAVGNPFAWGPDRGVYRTKDGGQTWQKVLFINDQTGVVSVAIDWQNPNELYAGAWRAQRKPWTIISGGPASEGGIYKSTDGGDHWTHLSNGLPSNLIGKTWLDIAQSNPKVVYAQIEAPAAEGGLYRSDDAGSSWKLVNNSARLRARPFYFNKVFVNPKDENEVYVTELGLHHSTDGGRTFTDLRPQHGDNHVVWINPDNPKIFIETNDGGANITQDGGQSFSTEMNQPTGEYYMVDVDKEFPYRFVGPQQDNSTVAVYNVPPFAWPIDEATQTWIQASGCESGQIRIVPDGSIIYGDCKGEFGRYSTATGQEQHYWIYPQQRYGLDPKDQRYRFVRQAPIEIDPFNPKVVYHGSQYVHKTTDGGIHWTKISPDVTANGPEGQLHSGEPITRDVTGEEVYAALYCMRASRTEPGVLWTGSNDGPVWVTRNGGRTWKNVTPKDLPPGGRVHTIEDSPHRKGSAYVSVYRIYLNDFKPYLYMTNDYGEHWTLLTDGTNGIPADEPMHVVREDPQVEGLLYAGTWRGAYVSFDQGRHWQSLQLNLPSTPVTDIYVKDNDLVVSTMGRSFWIMDDVEPLRELARSVMKAGSAPTNGARGMEEARSFSGANAGRSAAHPDIVLARDEQTAAPAAPAAPKAMRSPLLPPKMPVKAYDAHASVFLFTPAPAYRTHYVPVSGRPDMPEYPPVAALIDYSLTHPMSDLQLQILDAAGKTVRSFSAGGGEPAQAARGGGRRGGGGMSSLPNRAGMNRFVWDLRYAGPEGTFFGGPLVAPGTYHVRLTGGGVTKTEPLIVRIDPRYAKDGVTVTDLQEQTRFLLKVQSTLQEAQQLAARVRRAMDSGAGDKAQLEELYYKFANRPGPYPANMMIAQIQNIAAELSRADQKVGASAYERLTDVTKELAGLRAEVDRTVGR
ncbi:MAG: VPS10 domain-containing protein [Betaproteobacteria bacterium]